MAKSTSNPYKMLMGMDGARNWHEIRNKKYIHLLQQWYMQLVTYIENNDLTKHYKGISRTFQT